MDAYLEGGILYSKAETRTPWTPSLTWSERRRDCGRMFISIRKARKFVQVVATCCIVGLMIFWTPLDNSIMNHMKSYSYRYLINSYDFVNESLSISKHSLNRVASYPYLINHKEKCQQQDVLLLLFVKTSPKNRYRRNAIRQTWGNENYVRSQLNANIKVVFALGRLTDRTQQAQVQRKLILEDQTYNDLIQQDFLDTFHNLTLKLLLQFSWVNAYCPHAKFMMSADDDIFIHMPNLVAYLQSLAQMGVQDLWIGRVHRGSPPVRDKSSKYYVPYEMYQWPSYPDYTAGAAYVISSDVAAKVYEASQTLNTSLYIDDVFMGLCANKMRIVPQYHVFFSGEGKAPYHPCIYNKMMTSHGHVEDLHHLWKQATDPEVKNVTSGFLSRMYCKLVNIWLLCRIHYQNTYPCSAAFS
ncbi:lactosylceramide 1,3-N-acetyl-beta-D-glucosaminyltransferase [Alligator mississippiensis]|uniref:lactosylceramide 1,3-N-acetyl-beta-D-glucosaminyltransferase n=1 Tax=Alligator mississippiensis TaxID=8496 RepID=UPI0003D0BB81|nr:lactosylceramide 1,3-N-acetyl-beta-D-glucosaminyltransferase [Alligator mississippiensis]XP_006262088.1 lactosylceramide 1,3-N-acetyl-beta-D-glucosaminyltransferase [Alligator mississippiensis]XP_019333988.1 lactosylceramide 1,3-N-acetyl-beta-D-glucosaminyltransferase [Alligator mississippiensis]XP_059587170.1 lactosylceramide 1,3-N-acetyl-beta-D-glucosaminyltransferase [Alligator mississippiensis]XP_059587171.1 lactosylceramide 1,3-N-acetyl-beta-D-glucosaminyltransferase [Alligator mississi